MWPNNPDKKANERHERNSNNQGDTQQKKGDYSNSSNSGSSSNSQLDRINQELAKPNLSDSARQALQQKRNEVRLQNLKNQGN